MKTHSALNRRSAGYALILVLVFVAVAALVLAGTMQRTATVALLNERNNQYVVNLNAAEAATEKVVARLAYDFQAFGFGLVTNNLSLYRTNVPTTTEDPFWSNFEFSDGQGNANRTYVNFLTNYSGPLPSQYPGLFTVSAPVIRVLSNARSTDGRFAMTNAVQEDLLLALVPITQYAIFYNSLLEFSTCATMEVQGRTHANASIYVGTSASLTFKGTVTTTGTLSAPKNNGSGPWTLGGSAHTYFQGSPTYKTNVPTVTLSINMTNTHSMIDLPASGESPTSQQGVQRMFNQAHVILMVTNEFVTNTVVNVRIQNSVNGQVPGADSGAVTNVYKSTGTNFDNIITNLPFLTLTNKFRDQREDKDILTTQIDLGKYAQWTSSSSDVQTKFPSGSGTYPTILFASDDRATTSSQLTAVRITNGVAPPTNGRLGFTLATPNPLYVWGDYNCTNSAHLGTTNTYSTIPSALMSDALTILSSSWNDSTSFTTSQTGPDASSATTVNAAILTGIKPSTGNTASTFSGGVHNLPRLLEDWSSSHLWLNTSIINLFASTKATGQFVTPGAGSYYVPPTRHFTYDINFQDPAKQPPGIPCALVAIRMNWALPPANVVTYNVTP